MKIKNRFISCCLTSVLTVSSFLYAGCVASTGASTSTSTPTNDLVIGGTYSFGDNIETGPVGSVKVYPISDNAALFFLDLNRGAPSYNSGQLAGKMTIKNNIGYYDSTIEGEDLDCILTFSFTPQQLEIATESDHNDCGFGANVYAGNEYTLIDNSIPTYFVYGPGDTVLFKDMIKKETQPN